MGTDGLIGSFPLLSQATKLLWIKLIPQWTCRNSQCLHIIPTSK